MTRLRPRRTRGSPKCIPWRHGGILCADPNYRGVRGWLATIVVVLRATTATASQVARVRINATAPRVTAKAINGEHCGSERGGKRTLPSLEMGPLNRAREDAR